MKLVNFDDGHPMQWFKNGEERGFNYIFKEIYASLCLYSFRITKNQAAAEEIAANAFIKIWQRHERFNDLGSARAYLYTIARNDSLKWLRSKGREHVMHGNIVYLMHGMTEKEHVKYLVEAELLREIYGAINELPAACRKVFTMLYIEGKSIKQIAAELQLSVSTVKTQKQRGLAFLKKRFS